MSFHITELELGRPIALLLTAVWKRVDGKSLWNIFAIWFPILSLCWLIVTAHRLLIRTPRTPMKRNTLKNKGK